MLRSILGTVKIRKDFGFVAQIVLLLAATVRLDVIFEPYIQKLLKTSKNFLRCQSTLPIESTHTRALSKPCLQLRTRANLRSTPECSIVLIQTSRQQVSKYKLAQRCNRRS